MATNIQLLKAKICERAMTQAQVTAAIGMDESPLSRKLKTDGLSFSVGEMHKLAALLQLTAKEATRIFLVGFSHLCENPAKKETRSTMQINQARRIAEMARRIPHLQPGSGGRLGKQREERTMSTKQIFCRKPVVKASATTRRRRGDTRRTCTVPRRTAEQLCDAGRAISSPAAFELPAEDAEDLLF